MIIILESNTIYTIKDVTSEEFKKFIESEEPDKFFMETFMPKKPKYIPPTLSNTIYKQLIEGNIIN